MRWLGAIPTALKWLGLKLGHVHGLLMAHEFGAVRNASAHS